MAVVVLVVCGWL